MIKSVFSAVFGVLFLGFAGYVSAQDIDPSDLIAKQRAMAPKVDTATLKRMIDEKQDFVLLDVRTLDEIAFMGRIEAEREVAVPRGWTEVRVPNQIKNKDTPIVAYCGGGLRSAFVTNTLREMGYTNVRNYDAGIFGWKRAGLPVVE